MSNTDELLAELEESSKPVDDITGAIMENASPDDDIPPDSGDSDKRRKPWSRERRAKFEETIRSRKGSGGTRRASTKKPTKATVSSIIDQVSKGFAMIGGFWALRDEYCGSVVIRNSDKLGSVYGRAIAENQKLSRFFDGMAKGGRYGELVIVTLTVAIPILAHHDMIPRQIADKLGPLLDPDYMPSPRNPPVENVGGEYGSNSDAAGIYPMG